MELGAWERGEKGHWNHHLCSVVRWGTWLRKAMNCLSLGSWKLCCTLIPGKVSSQWCFFPSLFANGQVSGPLQFAHEHHVTRSQWRLCYLTLEGLRPKEELKFLLNEQMLTVPEPKSCNCFSKRPPSLCGIGDSKKDLSVEHISSSPW